MLILLINNYYTSPLVKSYITPEFIINLFQNIQNYDQDERAYLKLIIHKIFANSLLFRNKILKSIENKLLDIGYDCDKADSAYLGLAEIFEILSKIILFYQSV